MSIQINGADKGQTFPAMDIMKFIMSFLVIIIHRPIFPADFLINSFLGRSFAGVAVPFFFICSGFFFFRKLFNSEETKRKSILLDSEKRIFILYAIWTIIYLPCRFVKIYSGYYSSVSVKVIAAFCVYTVKDFFMSASFVHFWYLCALLWSFVIAFFLLKVMKPKTMLLLSALIALVLIFVQNSDGFVSPAISTIVDKIPGAVFNIFIVAMPCISIGAVAAEKLKDNPEKRYAVSLKKKVLLVVLWITYLIIDFALVLMSSIQELPRNIFHTVFVIVSAGAIFVFVLSLKCRYRPACKTLRNMSTVIYCCHLLIMSEGFDYIFSALNFDPGIYKYPIQFMVATIFSLIVSFTVVKLSHIKCLGFLKYLY